MNSNEILKTLKTLIGPIDPVEEEHVDKDRLENFKKYCRVFSEMHKEIVRVVKENKDSFYSSCSNIAEEGIKTLREIEDYE